MFDVDNPREDKAKLIDAVSCSLANCLHEQEYQAVKLCIVEFMSAIEVPDEEVVDILLSAAGMSADADDVIDELVEEFGGVFQGGESK